MECAFCHRKDEGVRRYAISPFTAIDAHTECYPPVEWHKTAREGVSISWSG